MTQHLAAPGYVDDWLDASQIALKMGEFTKIRCDMKKQIIKAAYGADKIAVTFEQIEEEKVRLTIDCTEKPVADWYRHCVKEVLQHPEQYQNDDDDSDEDELREDAEARDDSFAGRVQAHVRDVIDHIPGENPVDLNPLHLNKHYKDSKSKAQSDGRLPFWKRLWFAIVMLIVIPPVGLVLFFKYGHTGALSKCLVTLVTILYFLFIWLGFLGFNTGFSIQSVKNFGTNLQKNIVTIFNGDETVQSTNRE